jgi:hypothetical protein
MYTHVVNKEEIYWKPSPKLAIRNEWMIIVISQVAMIIVISKVAIIIVISKQ